MVSVSKNNNNIKVDVKSVKNLTTVSVGSVEKSGAVSLDVDASEIFANMSKYYAQQANQYVSLVQSQIETAASEVVAQATTQAERAESAADYTEEMLEYKADKATTLAGYNISDAYTKTETDMFVANTLTKSQITNCILEAPHMVDLELADGTLTLKAGSKVIVPYGTEAPTFNIGDSLNGGTIVDISWDGSNLFYVLEVLSDTIRTGYGVGSTDCNLFIKSDGVIYPVTVVTTVSGATDTSTNVDRLWYDTTNNIVKFTLDSGATYENYCSFPFVSLTRSSGTLTSIIQTFQSIGYIGSTIWCNKGLKTLIPNGRSEDGMLNNVEYTTPSISTDTGTATNNFKLYVDLNNKLFYTNAVSYNNEQNLNISTTGLDRYCCHIGNISVNTGVINSFEAYKPAQLVKTNDITKFETAYITETYVNGTSWYRIWSNGWCEQGGLTASGANGWATLSLLKQYKNTNYSLMLTGKNKTASGTGVTWGLGSTYPDSVSAFTYYRQAYPSYWEAKGYIA